MFLGEKKWLVIIQNVRIQIAHAVTTVVVMKIINVQRIIKKPQKADVVVVKTNKDSFYAEV